MSQKLAKLAAGKKNLTRDQILALEPEKNYDDGRTKQAFKDETDINKILMRAQKKGTISHLNKHEARYGEFANYDFFANTLMLTKGREIFDDLPSELRSEFNQSQAEFFTYVNDPANKDRLDELLPALAEPGRQNIAVNAPKADGEAAGAAASEPLASDDPPAPSPEELPAADPVDPPAGDPAAP